MQSLAGPAGVTVVAAGFSPAAELAALAEYLDWKGPFLSDIDRALYTRLGFGRAPLWRIYSPATVVRYARAVLRGGRLPRTTEDTRQLGGDALVQDGIVVRRWLPRTPSDRVAPATLVAAAR